MKPHKNENEKDEILTDFLVACFNKHINPEPSQIAAWGFHYPQYKEDLIERAEELLELFDFRQRFDPQELAEPSDKDFVKGKAMIEAALPLQLAMDSERGEKRAGAKIVARELITHAMDKCHEMGPSLKQASIWIHHFPEHKRHILEMTYLLASLARYRGGPRRVPTQEEIDKATAQCIALADKMDAQRRAAKAKNAKSGRARSMGIG